MIGTVVHRILCEGNTRPPGTVPTKLKALVDRQSVEPGFETAFARKLPQLTIHLSEDLLRRILSVSVPDDSADQVNDAMPADFIALVQGVMHIILRSEH
jgi:hypothetical protein